MSSQIEHVFVLMLENRSFDHMLGQSGLTGTDSKTNLSTSINGVNNNPIQTAPYRINQDPPHEFLDVFHQICGSTANYDPIIQYNIPKDNSGFTVKQFYDTANQLPVLNALAKEFVVCDNWFCSVPGPTWPNRFFLHAASSSGLDDSVSTAQTLKWDIESGIKFDNGTIFQQLEANKIPYQIYSGKRFPIEGSIPQCASLKGINVEKWKSIEHFYDDVIEGEYKPFYTFIEPNYGDIIKGTYTNGDSQHPTDDVRNGEVLIKFIYECIRNSKVWNNSVLIVTWDEHGGFFDHVVPPTCVAPGDSTPYSSIKFDFKQLGPRVPGLIISPLINKNLIDHTVYDHTSILKFLQTCRSLPSLTQRDHNANEFTYLFNGTARTDTPDHLPNVPEISKDEKFDDQEKKEIRNEFEYCFKKIQKELDIPGKTDITKIIKKIESVKGIVKPSACTCSVN